MVKGRNARLRRALRLTLCALFLLGMLLPYGRPGAAADFDGRYHILVSLGDSYSSGEGNPPFYGQDKGRFGKLTDLDWLAHRSTNSWGSLLVIPGVDGNMASNWNTHWYFAAASGAETEHITGSFEKNCNIMSLSTMLPPPEAGGTLPPQISVFDQIAEDHKGQNYVVDYVTMTMGGNDADFAKIVGEASSVIEYFKPGTMERHINEVWAEYFMRGGIRDKLVASYREILGRADEATLIIAGYPQLLNPEGSALFPGENAVKLNEAVSRFNKELFLLTEACKSSGMHICFADVEREFEYAHQAYTDDPYLYGILPPQSEDITIDFKSHYSMHPNYVEGYNYPTHLRSDTVVHDGVHAYAKCVQREIDRLEEEKGGASWASPERSGVREVVMVLDTSGSMDGEPIRQTIRASMDFLDTVLEEEASVGIVEFNWGAAMLSDFSRDRGQLMAAVDRLGAFGGTNTEDGLWRACEMLNGEDPETKTTADTRIIVLMSDGLPNNGKEGDALIRYADEIKAQGIRIYTLGFFSNLYYDEMQSAQYLMEGIASEGCHYEVDDADSLAFFFGDVADQISGQKYIYIRIACPVDVTVSYNGETLCSSYDALNTRTSFGTLSFEDGGAYDSDVDSRVKVLRLKEGVSYDLTINGTGEGDMDYSIAFADESGQYSDWREFADIPITEKTVIRTEAAPARTTRLELDRNGDGRTDKVYEAKANSTGAEVKEKKAAAASGGPSLAVWLLLAGGVLLLGAAVAVILVRRKKTADAALDIEAFAPLPVPHAPPVKKSGPERHAAPPKEAPAAPPAVEIVGTMGKHETESPKKAPAAPPAVGLVGTMGKRSAAPPKDPAFCKDCGAPLPGRTRFCPRCGKDQGA